MIRQESLRTPIDAARLRCSGFCLRSLCSVEVLRYWAYGRIERYYVRSKFSFPFVVAVWRIYEGDDENNE